MALNITSDVRGILRETADDIVYTTPAGITHHVRGQKDESSVSRRMDDDGTGSIESCAFHILLETGAVVTPEIGATVTHSLTTWAVVAFEDAGAQKAKLYCERFETMELTRKDFRLRRGNR